MDIRGLGYIGVDVADLDGWCRYAELLGIRPVPHGDGFAMKIDDRPFRVAVQPADTTEGLAFAGRELSDAAALQACAAGLAVKPPGSVVRTSPRTRRSSRRRRSTRVRARLRGERLSAPHIIDLEVM